MKHMSHHQMTLHTNSLGRMSVMSERINDQNLMNSTACYYIVWPDFIYRNMICKWRSIRPLEINQYDITMAIHYDITMGNDVARDAHCEMTIGNDVAIDIHCCYVYIS